MEVIARRLTPSLCSGASGGELSHFLGDIGRGGSNFGLGEGVKGSSTAIGGSIRKFL